MPAAQPGEIKGTGNGHIRGAYQRLLTFARRNADRASRISRLQIAQPQQSRHVSGAHHERRRLTVLAECVKPAARAVTISKRMPGSVVLCAIASLG